MLVLTQQQRVAIERTITSEICSKVRIRKYSSDKFRTPNGLKQGDALPLLFFNFALEIKTATKN